MRNPRPHRVRALSAAGAVLLAASAAWSQWGSGGSLFTESGVEISVDARVVTAFAMLNALGFDKETVFGEPPLEKPRYTKARESARSSLGRPGPGLQGFEKVVAKYKKPAYIYARAAIELGGAPSFKPAGRVPKMSARMLEPMRTWFNEEGGSSIFRQVSSAAKGDQRQLLKALNPATAKLQKAIRLGEDEDQLLDDTGPSGRVVFIYNPLDAHGTLHRFDDVDGVTYILAGPFVDDRQRQTAVDATLLAYARTLVAREAAKASGPGSAPATTFAKLGKDTRKALDDAKNVGTEALACALLQLVHPKSTCAASALVEDEAGRELVELVKGRAGAWLKEKTLLQEAAPAILGGASVPAPVPAVPITPGTTPPAAAAKPVPAPAKAAPAAKPEPAPAKKP